MDEPPAYTHRQVRMVFCGLALGMLLAALDQTIVATALPTIVSEVGGIDHLSWVVTAYLLAATISTPIYGRLGDLYGRKRLFQVAIVVFLVGSVFCGAAATMPQLIAARAVQGLGGGGLMVLGMAMIADVVSPRERGRYQGYFGGLFGVASVAGPVLGGIFTDELSWRWVFYMNLPLGVAALGISRSVLPEARSRGRHTLDYLGCSLLIATVTSFVLITTWGGREYAWRSPMIVGLAVAAVVMGMLFVFVERRVPEPVLPLRLFRSSTCRVASAGALIMGVAMLSAISFLPLLLQVAGGASATRSAFVLMPLLLAVPASSIVSGQIITRTGRYKVFPVVGLFLAAVGFALLSTIEADTPRTVSAVFMALVGVGLGFTMPVLILAVQNTADSKDLGVATSTISFFRSVGGSIGVAAFGAAFSARLDLLVRGALPDAVIDGLGGASVTPEGVRSLPSGLQDTYTSIFADALSGVFLYVVPLLLTGAAVMLLLREVPLQTRSHVVDRELADEQDVAEDAAESPVAAPVAGPVLPTVPGVALADAD